MKPLSWQTLDWAALERLREIFLTGKPPGTTYWSSLDDLANYDFTYAQRIAWKWDAVLRELKQRVWCPPLGPLLDWGCGSGIAGRRVVEFFGATTFTELRLFDHSTLATGFARVKTEEEFPGIAVQTGIARTVGTLVISHVLNELDEVGRRALRQVIDRADAVLWVEPGTYADSRALIAMREDLRERFHVIAPCTHHARCGLLTPENERHWCHHFAAPPAGIMADSNWVRFAQRAAIDLRSVPYSFLALERKGLREPAPGLWASGWSHVIGEPRVYKGFAKVLSCQSDGVRELELQKRAAPGVYKAFKDGTAGPLWRWIVQGQRIVEPQPFAAGTQERPK